MADEQVYVGEEGAKELYRRVKAIVPAVDDSLDISSGNAISNRAVTEALGMVTSFVKADGIGPDKHPDVENPSGRVIYLVHDELAPNPDQYKEWIWSTPPGEEPMWECIGDTSGVSGDSWKLWSENRDSYGDEESVYIGSNTVVEGTNSVAVGHDNTVDSESNNTSVFGKGNSVIGGNGNVVVGKANTVAGSEQEVFGTGNSSIGEHNLVAGENTSVSRDETVAIGQGNQVEVTDDTDYSGTDVVEIGTDNTATDAANAYQLGRENTVSGNNLANKEQYPHSMAMNLGRNNRITGEGVNIGKDNVSSTFGVTVGQRNQATDASIAIGEDVNSYGGSISIGHGKPTDEHNMLEMLSMTVDGEEIPAQKIKIDLNEYTYYARASVFKTASNTYEWGEIGEFSTRVTICENKSLNTYLVGGNSMSYSRVTGYFDSNGNFVSSTDPSYDIKEYNHITATNSIPVDFYCSLENGTMVSVSGYFRASDTQPEIGTVLNASEYAEWLSKLSIRDIAYDNIEVYTADLTAPAMKCEYNGTNRPFYTKYSVYGYRDDNNRFIPYNDVTKYKSDAFSWETVPADELHASRLDPGVVGVEAQKTVSRNDSISIGKSMEADTSSFGVGVGTIQPYVTYERWSEAGNWIGYHGCNYITMTLSQVDGSVAESAWQRYNRVWFNDKVDDVSWQVTNPARNVMGNSIAILNTGSNSSLDNHLSGASVGIGNGLKLTDNSFGFGTNIEGDNNSVLVGANLTAQVGGSTLVGRDISVKIGDSDNDGGSITGEYDGGLVAFGMSIQPSPGSVTVGRSSVTTGRGSVAVGAFGITAKRGGVVYGRNSVYAEGRATAIGTDGISAKNASITVGLDGSSAEDGSAAFGTNGISAYSGSISIGRDGNSARYGSLALGFSNRAESGSTSVGTTSVAQSGAFVFGRNSRAENGGITIATSGSSVMTYRSASGSIIKFRNPDNVYVPIMGSLSIKPGYQISKVRSGPTCIYDGKQCRIVDGHYDDGGYYNSGDTVDLYDESGTFVASVTRTNEMNASYYGSTSEYWMVYDENTGKYTFVSASYNNPAYSETSNIEALKSYLRVQCSTFHKDGQLYVYANGFNYPDTDLSTEYVDVASCTFNTYDYWTYEMLGYEREAWHRFTDIGGYDQGIAIGRDAHSQGSSLSLGTNNGNSSGGNTIEIENAISANGNNFPTYVGIRFKSNYTHANGYSIAMGFNGVTAEGSSMALGYDTVRAYNHSLAIGYSTNVADECSMAIGRDSNSATDYSFAVGDHGNYAEHNAFAVGTSGNRACGYSVSLGYSNISNDMSVAIGKYSTAETYSTSFGDSAYSYHYGMAIGNYARAMDYSIALGKNNRAYSYSVSIGDSTYAYNYSVNVGRDGRTGNRSIAVGIGNSAFHYSVALGRDNNAGGYPSIETESNAESIAIGTQNYAYSYGVSIGRGNTAYGRTVSIGMNNSMNYPDASPYGTLLGDSNFMQSGGYNLGIGNGNIVGYESIAIGRNNYSYNWSIMMGFNNSANQNSGAHATIIGYGNYNNTFLEYLAKDGSNYETNSIILGSHNSAYHHNAILIGCGNTTAASQETSQYTDDDGFMLAVGYKNYVGRNYDIAIGYKSYAYGGENVALQNSHINGFHNFAFNQSNIYNGISNVAMNQSSLSCPGIDSRDGVTYNHEVTNNMLLHSTFNISDSATMYGGFTGNLLLESVVNCANQSNNVNFNLIYMGGQDNPLYLENGYFYNNIIFGTRRANLNGLQSSDEYTTVLRGSIGRSLFINSYTQIEDATSENCQDNIISNSSIKISHIESMQGITCIDSTMDIAGPVHILDSVLLAKSRLYLRMDNNRYPFQKNLIIDSLVTDFSVSEGDGVDDYNQVSGNLVMGTRLHGSYACFSFSDHHDSFYNYYKPVITTEYEATISKSRRIFNFGDNSTFSSANVFSAGLGNRISDAEGCFIYGKENVLSGAQTGIYNGRSIQNIYMIGTQNASYYYNDSNVRTGIEIRSIQNGNGSSTYGIVPATATLGYIYDYYKQRRTITQVTSGYYLYDGDAISAFDSTTAAKYNIPIVQITPSEFNAQLAAHTLIGNTVYNFTTGGSISQLYLGEVLYPDKRYDLILETYASSWDPQRYGVVIHESSPINFQADRAEQQFWCFMLGDNNRVNATNATHNYLIGANNAISKNQIDDDNAEKMYYHQILDKILTRESFKFSPVDEYELPYGRLTSIYSREYLYSYGCLKEVPTGGIVEQSMTGETLYNRFNAGTLEEGKIYKSTSYYSCPQPIPGFITVFTYENYSFDGVEQKITGMNTRYSRHSKYGARNVHGNFAFGNDNVIHENIMNSMLIGSGNELISSNNDTSAYSNGEGISNVFVQGNNNVAKFGSNIISMGNGNISVGHNSVAIGSQLISSQWQTVIGKYNTPIAGPNRLESENPNDSTKAIFIIGNGYSTEDGVEWQDESLITRSNAMVVYADGTVTAKKFISSEPEITLVPGNGISFSDNVVDNTRTIAVTQEIADFLAFLGTRPATGEYTINSTDGVLSWTPISTRTV